MNEITLDQLTDKHLNSWQAIDVIDGAGVGQRVWDSRRMAPIASASAPTKLTEYGSIKIASLKNDLEVVYAKLTAIDPLGDKRLVR